MRRAFPQAGPGPLKLFRVSGSNPRGGVEWPVRGPAASRCRGIHARRSGRCRPTPRPCGGRGGCSLPVLGLRAAAQARGFVCFAAEVHPDVRLLDEGGTMLLDRIDAAVRAGGLGTAAPGFVPPRSRGRGRSRPRPTPSVRTIRPSRPAARQESPSAPQVRPPPWAAPRGRPRRAPRRQYPGAVTRAISSATSSKLSGSCRVRRRSSQTSSREWAGVSSRVRRRSRRASRGSRRVSTRPSV